MLICPVCRSSNAQDFARLDDKLYYGCATCEARWLDRASYLSLEDEVAHYNLHQNDLESSDYRAFLLRLAEPVLSVLKPNQQGLDFGCGPAPLLAKIFEEQDHKVDLFDPSYATNNGVFDKQYDFVVSSETVEHFHDPATEFAAINEMVKPGGYIGIMTSFYPGDAAFADWHYRRDPTHVVFYSMATFETLASKYGWSCHSPARNVVVLKKDLNGEHSNSH